MEQVQQQGKIHQENLHDKQVLIAIHCITKVYISHHINKLLTAIKFACPDFHLITFPRFYHQTQLSTSTTTFQK